MPSTSVASSARKLLEQPLDFDGFLAKLTAKDRTNAERRAATLDAEGGPQRAALWRRLAGTLLTLAPVCKLVGKQTIQFYIPDGKYRMQVFALEDLQDGNLTVYCPNQLQQAIDAGFVKPDASQPNMCIIKGSKEQLFVETLDGATINPGDHVKDLVGWNRKALRIMLPPNASPTQIEAAEFICAVAAVNFPKPKPEATA